SSVLHTLPLPPPPSLFLSNTAAPTDIYTLSLHDALPILLSLIIDGIVVNVASAPAFLMLSSPQEVVDWLLNVSDGIDAEMPAGIGIASLLSFVLWFVYRAAVESSGMKGSLSRLATGQRVVIFE